jgi:hypothetical protein
LRHAYLQPQLPASGVLQHVAFSDGSQHCSCSADEQQDEVAVIFLADLPAKKCFKLSATPVYAGTAETDLLPLL